MFIGEILLIYLYNNEQVGGSPNPPYHNLFLGGATNGKESSSIY